MKALITFAILTATQTVPIQAEEKDQGKEVAVQTLESLVTTKEKSYKNVTIREVTPSGIRIFHESGSATIPYEELPEDLRTKLGGFDPEKAREHREKENRILRQQDVAMETEDRKAKQQKQLKGDLEFIDGAKQPTRIQIKQMDEGGALCVVSYRVKQKFQERIPRPLGGFDVKERERWVWTGYGKEWVFVAGVPKNLVDEDTWEGWTLPLGSYVYTTALGARKTVRQLEVVEPPEER
jgi:hypothetical protein